MYIYICTCTEINPLPQLGDDLPPGGSKVLAFANDPCSGCSERRPSVARDLPRNPQMAVLTRHRIYHPKKMSQNAMSLCSIG